MSKLDIKGCKTLRRGIPKVRNHRTVHGCMQYCQDRMGSLTCSVRTGVQGGQGYRGVAIRCEKKKKKACNIPLLPVLVCHRQLEEGGGIRMERQMGVGARGG